ncbi:hypothetical protein BSKO_07924 [Bryopsis sp. KO-2023]|nr:hypothetical protein BSKO_07924 [Bryopsis sp. KO-2023]
MPAEWSWVPCRKSGAGKCSRSGGQCGRKSNHSRSSSQDSGHSLPCDDRELRKFWSGLSITERKKILTVEKKELFKRIRCLYCSRCYGLFQLRYEELRGNPPSDCPTCKECYSSLVVGDDGSLRLQEDIISSDPFQKFLDAKSRERERELQFMTGNICGSGWVKRPGQNMCSLHTTPVPCEALAEYWSNLPDEHRSALFCLTDEDFVADLDAHLKYQLKICRDCRSNVMRAFKDLKSGKDGGEPEMAICKDHVLKVGEGIVSVAGTGGPLFFEKAEEVEENKVSEGIYDADAAHSDDIRHAETPALAQEALQECALLIFKSQAEVAFREQSAGHNALLLFVHLTLQIMEQNLVNAFKELGVKQAEAELLELLAVEQLPAKKTGKKSRGKKKKGAKNTGLSSSPSPPESIATPEETNQDIVATVSPRPTSPLPHSPFNEPAENEKESCDDSIEFTEVSASCAAGNARSTGEKEPYVHFQEREWKREASMSDDGEIMTVEGPATVDEKKYGVEERVSLNTEDWPTPQESKSILQSIKIPTTRTTSGGIGGLANKVDLQDVQEGESTPPGDFRIHALNSLKKHDSAVSLEKGIIANISQAHHKSIEQKQASSATGKSCMPRLVQSTGNRSSGGGGCGGEEDFSLFHRFPGDYTLVYSPPRGCHLESPAVLDKTPPKPKPTEFDRCYTLFGSNPLVSVFKLSLVPFAQVHK